MYNEIPLHYWQMNGYREEDVEEEFAKMPRHALAVMVRFRDGAYEFIPTRDDDHPTIVHRADTLRMLLDAIISGFPQIKGSIIFWCHDGYKENFHYRVPIFAYGKHRDDRYTFLMPDADYSSTGGYADCKEQIDKINAGLAWEKKFTTALWRGSSSGSDITLANWRENPRVKLCLTAKEINDEDKINAYLSSIVQCDGPEAEEAIRDAGIVGEPIHFTEFARCRYQINVDGNAPAWSSLFRKLRMNAAVLKVESEMVQWYFSRLRPWEHFIPVRADMEDLEEKLDWAFNHDMACRLISQRAFELTEDLNPAKEISEFYRLLVQVLHCQRPVMSAPQQVGAEAS